MEDAMNEGNTAHFSKKHASGVEPNPAVEAALKTQVSNGELPCAVAFKIAADLDIAPKEVGRTADLLEMRLTKCQLGLFGHQPEKRIVKPAESVSEELEAAIREGQENGRLPCKTAWRIAAKLGLRKMQVSSACEALQIKIASCQIGAF